MRDSCLESDLEYAKNFLREELELLELEFLRIREELEFF